MVEKASIDEAFIACCPPEGTDYELAFAEGSALAERVKAAGALSVTCHSDEANICISASPVSCPSVCRALVSYC